MKTLRIVPALFAAAALLAASPSQANLIGQAPIDQVAGIESAAIIGTILGDTFALSQESAVSRIRWWGTPGATADDFNVGIFDDLTGGPAVFECGSLSTTQCDSAIVESFAGLTDSQGNNIASVYMLALATPLTLNVGSYLLSVTNEGSSQWFWQLSEEGDGQFQSRLLPSDAWGIDFLSANLSFEVLFEPVGGNSVPEPGVLTLLGLAGLIAGARRRACIGR